MKRKTGFFFVIPLVCTIFAKKKGIMDETDTQRLPQENQRGEAPIRGILEQAETVARGVLESIQAVAGTTDCKGVQIARLTDFAKKNNCWINDNSILGTFEDRGSENEVYLSPCKNIVYKLNDFRYSDDNLTPFFDRIKAHNTYFPDCAYTLIGFAENRDGKTCAVLSQPYIISGREATAISILSIPLSIGPMMPIQIPTINSRPTINERCNNPLHKPYLVDAITILLAEINGLFIALRCSLVNPF